MWPTMKGNSFKHTWLWGLISLMNFVGIWRCCCAYWRCSNVDNRCSNNMTSNQTDCDDVKQRLCMVEVMYKAVQLCSLWCYHRNTVFCYIHSTASLEYVLSWWCCLTTISTCKWAKYSCVQVLLYTPIYVHVTTSSSPSVISIIE
jgi:hypothetical protein